MPHFFKFLFVTSLLFLYSQAETETAPSSQENLFALLPLAVTQPAEDRQALLEAHLTTLAQFEDLNYRAIGSILEALVRAKLATSLDPEKFEVKGGIQYADSSGQTLGELDLVIFHKETQDVLVIGEIKLSNNLARAEQRARNQLFRFQQHIANEAIARIWKGNQQWQPQQFENITQYWLCGPLGAVEAGWDIEADLTREEGDLLQQMWLETQ